MLSKLNRQDCIEKFPAFPLRSYNATENEFDYYDPQTFRNYTLTLAAKSYKGHIKLLGIELADMASHMGYSELIFLGDSKTPWLSLNHDYKPAMEGLQYLADNKIGKKFNGALLVDTGNLPTFIKHLAWLVRCNAIEPYVHFIDHGQNITGSICQYGNLHISTKNKKADNLFKKAIDKSRLEFLGDNTCSNKYYKSGTIKGRKML